MLSSLKPLPPLYDTIRLRPPTIASSLTVAGCMQPTYRFNAV